MFTSVHGHNEAKKLLQDLVIKPFKQKKHSSSSVVSILLIGPAGCGKTFLGKALAGELKEVATYHHLHSSSIISHSKTMDGQIKYFQDEVRKVLDARPSVLLLDDLSSEDCMFPCAFTSEFGERLVEELIKIKRSNYRSGDASGVALIGATQSPWKMDENLWKFFDVKIYLKDLKFDERLAFLQQSLGNINLKAGVVEELVKHTEYCTGGDLMVLSKDISAIPLRVLMAATHFKVRDENGKRVYSPCLSDEDGIPMKLSELDNIADYQIESAAITQDDAIKMLPLTSQKDNWTIYKLYEDTRPT